jgi:hypothetical protein
MKLKMNEEVWKDIIGFEGLYMISSHGNVRSLNYNHTKKEKILKPGINGNGYYYVSLCKDGKHNNLRIHRLIAIHFVDNPNNFEYVDHINRNPKDNRISNLRWCTPTTNTQNKTKMKNASSQYYGVSWNKKHKKWHTRISINGKNKHLGYYDNEEEAARVYDKHALELFGINARTNFTY